MAEYIGQFYSQDIVFKKSAQFDSRVFNTGTILYEVLRISSGTVLFLEDHIARLKESIRLSDYPCDLSVSLIHYLLRNLISKNKVNDGNVKIILHFNNSSTPVIYTFIIPHFYPTPAMVQEGVKTDFFKAVRSNPNVKKLHPEMIQRIVAFISAEKLYDALLLDEKGEITEGSKTNIFFVQDNELVTAPGNKVLKGITRQKIFLLCKELNINIVERSIYTPDISSFDAAFFTGTSPKVLPINHIGDASLNVSNRVMTSLIKAYDDLIQSYIYRW